MQALLKIHKWNKLEKRNGGKILELNSKRLLIGKTIMLVPQVYYVCIIGLVNFKRAQLVPQVLKLSCISHFTNYRYLCD